MTAHPGDAGRAATHELRREQHERAVHLIDATAMRCGVSGATVHNWELGHARPAGARMDGYYRLLRALQADFARGGGAL